MTTTTPGPHQAIAANTTRERFCTALFDALWQTYRERVPYVQTYEEVVAGAGAKFVNDHIAFRTIAAQTPTTGIITLARIFLALGYQPAGSYQFPDKQLSAVHFQHANPQFPKLFISELKTWELTPTTRAAVADTVSKHAPMLPLETLAQLQQLDQQESPPVALLEQIVAYFQTLPWPAVEKKLVEAVNKESQYAAWVLVHGYNVNHFTSLINSHGVPALDDIEKTVAALTKAGVPMKKEIEGERGSKLRQTATEAVSSEVPILVQGQPATLTCPYA
ncbi:MAG TPA: DUF1338 domain-containing protein, partial [Pirellulaceae bacterium]|nr:DUF1338 domain-containing protein [Pirellulaceae bacterium]